MDVRPYGKPKSKKSRSGNQVIDRYSERRNNWSRANFPGRILRKKILKVPASPFYAEAIRATSKHSLKKRIEDLSKEKVFYNPIFRNVNLKTIPIPRRCEREEIYTYGEVIDEYTKQSNGQEHKAFVANIFPKIIHTVPSVFK